MATNKVITVTTIPTRTGDTVASYNAYSSVDGLLGSLSVAEAAAGKTFSLSDGSSHNITVKTVWTTYGESTTNVSNVVVVDLGTSAFAINTQRAQDQYLVSDTSNWAQVFDITFRCVTYGNNDGAGNQNYMGNDYGPANLGYFGIRATAVNEVTMQICDSVGTQNGTPIAMADGDKLSMRYDLTDFTLYKNDVLVDTISGANWSIPVSKRLVLGAIDDSPSYETDATFYEVSLYISAELFTWDFAEQTGTTATSDSTGRILTLNPGTGSTTTMWTST